MVEGRVIGICLPASILMSSLKWTCSSLTCFYEDINYTGASTILGCQCRQQWGGEDHQSYPSCKAAIPATYLLVLDIVQKPPSWRHVEPSMSLPRSTLWLWSLCVGSWPLSLNCISGTSDASIAGGSLVTRHVSLCFEKEKRNLYVFPDCLLERRISWLRHTMPEEIFQKFFPIELFGVGAPTGMLFQFSQAVEPCKTPNEKT